MASPEQRTNRYRIAAIGGDGIGPEVVSAAVEVLQCLATTTGAFALAFSEFDWNSARYLKTGRYLPDDALDQLRQHDAILFGAVGSRDVPDHISLWGLRLAICQGLDWVIVRENSEGEYSGQGGRSHRGQPHETATEVSIFTRTAVERIHRFAFALAQTRPDKHLTLVTKSNAQRFGLVMWDEIFYEVAKDFPDVRTDRELVDAMTMRMVNRPASLDTIVATNLHADILSDLAAALAGSLGIAPTANLNPERAAPSMFEPIHGSAFDLIGKGIANPIATFWSGAMMLEHLGEPTAAKRLMAAIEAVTRSGPRTPDLGGKGTTAEVTKAVCRAIEAGH